MHVHQHFSRRLFMAGGAALGAGLLLPDQSFAGPPPAGAPKPTANKLAINGLTFSLVSFGQGIDASSITDFNGFLGISDVRGSGTATNPDGSKETLLYDTDMRFMQGVYRDTNGNVQQGTFGFV